MPQTEPVLIPPRRFAVIGGDGRMTHASERLVKAGHAVVLLGCGADGFPAESHSDRIRRAENLADALQDADVILLPLPTTRDGETVTCPRDPARVIRLDEIAATMTERPSMRLLGGRMPTDFLRRINGFGAVDGTVEKNITPRDPSPRAVDYYLDEGLQLRNAYITAEAALMTAMQLSDRTLRGMTVVVIGYGRIGRMLTRLLLALGAEVTVAARRAEALLWAECEGASTWPLATGDRPDSGLLFLCAGYDMIFNTVPTPILGRESLSRMAPGSVILDLASAPFGVSDMDAHEAAARGVRYVRAPSLPGVYAPREAGHALADCVLEILRRDTDRKENLL